MQRPAPKKRPTGLALTEGELKSIEVPMIVFFGDQDWLVKGLYVKPLKQMP
ncbi:MAG TPA: hypothetical protein VHB99_11700 [Pirellulales bacterium]|nr:hypothetical protein [Pirellulales bacterium]